jgi:hypothetical protein
MNLNIRPVTLNQVQEKKIWYMYTMEFYSVIKKDEIMWFDGIWMELEDLMLSEISQVQKDKGRMFSFICGR